MAGRPYSGFKAQAETVVAVEFDDDEKTAVDPGALDEFEEARTVADPPEEHRITAPTDVPVIPASTGNETVDEATIEEQSGVPRALPDASLLITQGPSRGERIQIAKTTLTVGRALDNDVVVADTSVSRRHLKIEFDGIHFFIQDLGSGNGTIINGRDEDDRYQLAHRDALELGRTIIAFDCPALETMRPAISPPRPRADPPPRPTASMRNASHPAFDDVDEDASTIAGQRLPGPNELPLGGGKPLRAPTGRASGKNRSLERPEDLVVPRRPPNNAQPRTTMPSSAVPAPVATPRPSPVRARRPTSIPPPIPRSSPTNPPFDDPDSEEGLTRPAHPGQFAGARPMSTAATSLPPQPTHAPRMPTAAPQTLNQRVVYPTAPQQYMRSAPPSAVTPRPVNMGVVRPQGRNNRARLAWIAAIVIIAGIVGVTLAAVVGGDDEGATAGGSSTEAVTPDAGVTQSATLPDAAPDPQIAPLVDAGADPDPTPDKPIIEPKNDDILTQSNPVVRGSLATGAELPPTTWGTAEDVIESLPEPEPEVKPLETDTEKDDGDTKGDDGDDGDTKGDDGDDRRDDDRAQLASLQRRAKAAYRDRNFSRAASSARAAAKLAPSRLARRLRGRATNYTKLGKLLSSATRNNLSNPRVAMSSYLRARAVDRRLGNEHRRFINNQLQLVAPKAARNYMAANDFVGAKKAVDAARGAGDKVQTADVMRSLENKARPLIAQAKKAKRGGDESAAKKKLFEAKQILPNGSPLVREVRQLLND